MVDLHMHTIHSDGTWSTEKLLQEAEKAKLDYISITDHNSVKSYIDIKNTNISKLYSGKIITGCEFTCFFNDARIELLGYNIDVENTNEWIEKNYHYKNYNLQEEFNKLVELCKNHNIRLTENLVYVKNKELPYDTIYNDIIKYPENKTFFTNKELASATNFFRSATCNKQNPLHLNFNIDPTAKEVSDFIRNIGGKVVLAHAFLYIFDNTLEIIDDLIANNIIDGIEVYHTGHKEKEVEILQDICKQKKLLVSAGSDCHGDKKKERRLGKIFDGKCIENIYIKELLKCVDFLNPL